MTNFCVKCYTSVCCSIFYLVISAWGIIFLGILAILFGLHKSGNIGDFKNTDEENCQAMYIAVCIYVVLAIFYAIVLKYRLSHPFPDDSKPVDEDDDDIGIGADPAAPQTQTEVIDASDNKEVIAH